jgi:hypothetical protein
VRTASVPADSFAAATMRGVISLSLVGVGRANRGAGPATRSPGATAATWSGRCGAAAAAMSGHWSADCIICGSSRPGGVRPRTRLHQRAIPQPSTIAARCSASTPRCCPRLDELEEALLARHKRAIEEGRRGEVEGLDLTLTFLCSKREQAPDGARGTAPCSGDSCRPAPEVPAHRQVIRSAKTSSAVSGKACRSHACHRHRTSARRSTWFGSRP